MTEQDSISKTQGLTPSKNALSESLGNALQIQNNQLQITAETFAKAFSTLLTNNFHQQNQIIKIDDATLVEDPDKQALIFTGTSNYLNIPNIPVTARFSLNEKGEVVSSLTYTLIAKSQSAAYWKFSRSFPDLPVQDNFSSLPTATKTPKSFLDSYLFNEAYCVVNSHPRVEPDFAVELGEGINFVGNMKAANGIGVIANLLEPTQTITLYGLLNIPRPNQRFQPELKKDVAVSLLYPWDLAEDIPGIHLQARIDQKIHIGKVEFKDPTFRMFSPLSDDWAELGDFFTPTRAFTGDFALGKKAEIELIMKLDEQADTLSVEAKCDNISLENLADLAHITGSNSLTDEFPSALTSVTKELGKIELTDLAFTVAYGKTGLNITWATFALGIPDINWKVWGDHIVVDELGFRVNVYTPFSAPAFGIDLWGKTEIEGVPLDLKASKSEGYILLVKLGREQTLPLSKYIKKIQPDLPALPDLTIDDLALVVSPGQFYKVMGSLADKPNSWEIEIGPERLIFSDITFDIELLADGQTQGSFGGTIEIGKNIHLTSQYTIPGEFSIEARCDRMTFADLVAKLNPVSCSWPHNLDFTLTDTLVSIKGDKTGNTFMLMSRVENLGMFAFEAREVGGKMGIAGGVSLEAKPSDIPGLGFLKTLEKTVQLEDFLLVLSSYDGPNFRFPEAAQFSGNQNMSSIPIKMPQQAQGGLVAGLNLYCKWHLNTENKEEKLLRSLLGLDPTIDVTVQIADSAKKTSRMYIDYETTLAKHIPLSCKTGLAVTDGTPEFFLTGDAQVKIGKQLLNFDIAMDFVVNGAFLGGSMEGVVKFGGLTLSNLALVMGISWEGIPSLGIAASLTSSSFNSSLAVFLDSENPGKSLLAGAVSKLTLKDIATDLSGIKNFPHSLDKALEHIDIEGTHNFAIPAKVAHALDSLDLEKVAVAFHKHGKVSLPTSQDQLLLAVGKKGKSWNLTNMADNMRHYQLERKGHRIKVSLEPQFYFAPETTYIGALRFDPGVMVNGCLNILGLKMTTYVDINPSKGIAVDSYLNKALIIHDKNFFNISDISGKKGPRVSVGTYKQPHHKVKAFRKPHFYINGKFDFLGLEDSVYANFTTKGMELDVKGRLASDVHFDIKAVLNHSQGFDADGKVVVTLGKINLGKLGKVDLKDDLEGDLNIYANKKDVGVKLNASFEVFGKKHSIANAKLDVKTKALKNLAKTVEKEAVKLLTEFFMDAEKWASAVGKGVVAGVKDVEKVLREVHKLPEKEVKLLIKKTGIDKLGKEIGKTAEKVGKEVGKDANNVGKEVGKDANNVAKGVSKDVDQAGKDVKNVAKTFSNLFK